jgi:hypothetical protein
MRRRHEDEVVSSNSRDRQHDVIFSPRLQREHVDDRLAARGARALRHLPDLEPVQPAAVGEAQDRVVRVGDEQLVDPVVLLGRRRLLAAAAALLRAVVGQRLALDVAGVRQRHHHVLRRDQVLGRRGPGVAHDLASGARRRTPLQREQLVAMIVVIARAGQDVEQVGDAVHHLAVLADDLVLLQPGQALQAHLQDLLRLRRRTAVQAVGLQPELARQARRAVGRAPAPARASISRTSDESQARAISSALATGGVGAP